ncbi:MAG: serine/threonine protein kinase, partial [Gammaproteobacteria bacterium]|nr:serine/threonine protein kinase [Gammaproteobacteria bacterium]
MDETEIRPILNRGALPLPNGYVLADRYTVQAMLGEGGFGVTYLAKHNLLADKLVAIKEYLPKDHATRDATDSLRPKSAEDLPIFDWGLKSFIDESNRLYRLTRDHAHSGIVAVEDVFQANNTAYMVMEHIEGHSLRQLIDMGPIAEEQILRIALHGLNALETVHNAGLVHRDVTPSNVLIRASNNLPVLIDFGSAREDFRLESGASDQTTSGSNPTVLFSPGYAPIEQYEATTQDARTDIYSFASTLYHAMFRVRPMPSPQRQGALKETKIDPLESAKSQGGFSTSLLGAVDAGISLDIGTRPKNVSEWRKLFDFPPSTLEQTAAAQSPPSGTLRALGVTFMALLVVAAGALLYKLYFSSPDFDKAFSSGQAALVEAPTAPYAIRTSRDHFLDARRIEPESNKAKAASEACDEILALLGHIQSNDVSAARSSLEAAREALGSANLPASIDEALSKTFAAFTGREEFLVALSEATVEVSAIDELRRLRDRAVSLAGENARVVSGAQAFAALEKIAGMVPNDHIHDALRQLAEVEDRILGLGLEAGSQKARADLQEKKARREAQLSEQWDTLLVSDPLLTSSTSRSRELLNRLERVNPDHPKLRNGFRMLQIVDALRGTTTRDASDSLLGEAEERSAELGLPNTFITALREQIALRTLEQRREQADATLLIQPMTEGTLRTTLEALRALSEDAAKLEGQTDIRADISTQIRFVESLAHALSTARGGDVERAKSLLAELGTTPKTASAHELARLALTQASGGIAARALAEAKALLSQLQLPADLNATRALFERALQLEPSNEQAQSGIELLDKLSLIQGVPAEVSFEQAWLDLGTVATLGETLNVEGVANNVSGWLLSVTQSHTNRHLGRALAQTMAAPLAGDALEQSKAAALNARALAELSRDPRDIERTDAMLVLHHQLNTATQAFDEALQALKLDASDSMRFESLEPSAGPYSNALTAVAGANATLETFSGVAERLRASLNAAQQGKTDLIGRTINEVITSGRDSILRELRKNALALETLSPMATSFARIDAAKADYANASVNWAESDVMQSVVNSLIETRGHLDEPNFAAATNAVSELDVSQSGRA